MDAGAAGGGVRPLRGRGGDRRALGLASGLPFPYWAQIAAIAPLSAPGRTLQVERGLHRIIGTTLGIVTTAFLLSFPAQPWQLVVWVVVLQFLAEMYVLRNYSFALLFITPLALLMVQIAHPQPIGAMLEARVLETAIGAVVGIAVVIAAAPWDRWAAKHATAESTAAYPEVPTRAVRAAEPRWPGTEVVACIVCGHGRPLRIPSNPRIARLHP